MDNRSGRLHVSTVSLLPALLVAGTFAHSASAQEAGGAPPADTSAVGLEEIIVSARKRDERLEDVPAAITAIGSDELNRYSTNSVTEMSSRVPQLVIGSASGPGGAAINLRGVGAAGTNPTVDQAVSLNIDGIQLSQANAANLGFTDLQRVEVLKGPQALFYGKNSLGGIISLVSEDPGDSFESSVRAGYEFESERQRIEGMLSSALTDTLGVRLVAAYSDQEGFFDNRLNDVPGGNAAATDKADQMDELFVRGTLKFEAPGGRFDARLKVAYSEVNRDNGVDSTFQVFSCPFGVPQLNFGATGGVNDCKLDNNLVDPVISTAAAAAAPRYLRDGDPFFQQEQFLTSLTMNFAISDSLALASVSGLYDYAEDWNTNYSGTEFEAVVTGTRLDDRQYTQELRLASSFDSRFNFLVGGFYQDATKDFDAPLVLNGAATGFTGPLLVADDRFRQQTEAYSLFAQGIVALTDQVELTVGGRYSWEEKQVQGSRYASLLSGFSPAPVPFVFDPSKEDFTNFSPDVTLRYRITPEVTVYAAYREGFTSGGFNAVPGNFSSFAPNDVAYDQATAEGGELGVKGTAADRQVRFDVTTYYYDYKNLQLAILDPSTISLSIENAASAQVYGAEASLAFSPRAVDGLTLSGNVAYNRGRYDSYPDAACYSGQSAAQGCNRNLVPLIDPTGTVVGTHFSAQDLSGEPLERAPDWGMNFGFLYDLPLSDRLNITIGGEAAYTDSYIAMPEHDPRSLQDEAWRYNASIALRAADDGWELSLMGRNLSNELRIASAFGMPLTGGVSGLTAPTFGADLAGSSTEPRAVMLQLTLRNSLLK